MKRIPQNYQLINDQAFLFFPSGNQVSKGNGKDTKRLIFSGEIQFSNFENEQLSKLKKALAKQNIVLSQYWDKGLMLRFLQGNQYDIKKTISQIIEHSQFAKQNQHFKISPITEKFLKLGVIYYSGRDSCYRPIVVIDAKKIIDLKMTVNQFYLVLKQFTLFEFSDLLIQGQVQNIVCILDIGYSNIISMATCMKDGVAALSKHFKARNFKTYVANCPSSMSFIWNIVKHFLNDDQRSKMNFFDNSNIEPIFQHANKDQVQVKYGGNRPNMSQFWPVSDYSSNFQLENSKNKLISITKYQQMYLNDQLKGRKINKKFIDQMLLLNQSNVSKQMSNSNQQRHFNHTQAITTQFSEVKQKQQLNDKSVKQIFKQDINVLQEKIMIYDFQFNEPLSFY